MRPYIRLGVGIHDLEQGRFTTFAHAFGAEFDLHRWFVLDLGYLHTGNIDTGSFPTDGLVLLKNPDFGGYYQNRAGYLVPMARARLGPLSLAGGAGAGWVQSRNRSYPETIYSPQIYAAAETYSHWEWVYRASVRWQIAEAWALDVNAYQTEGKGYNTLLRFPPGGGGAVQRWDYRSRAILIGLTLSPEWKPGRSPEWTLSLGPAFSSASFHANFRAATLGWDLAVRRQLGERFSVELGHLETGAGTDRSRYADGRFLATPPYSADDEARAHLEVRVGLTYLLLGAERSLADRGTVGLALGAGYADATFRTARSPVFLLPWARFYDRVGEVAFVGPARADRHLGRGWHAGVTVRYTDFEGVQIVDPSIEPMFGNTKVRLWSVMPRLSLAFGASALGSLRRPSSAIAGRTANRFGRAGGKKRCDFRHAAGFLSRVPIGAPRFHLPTKL